MLAYMSWTQWALAILLICVCLFLMLVILLQRGRGGGIASAFGGGGGSGAFGAKTGDVFTWITVVVAGVFVVLSVVANYAFDQSRTTVEQSTQAPEDKPQLIPVKVGEDGTALPINLERIPAEVQQQGVESVTITPSTPPPAPAAGAAPPPTATPPPQPADKPKEEPKSP